MKIDTKAIEALAKLLDDKNLGEIEVCEGDNSIRVVAKHNVNTTLAPAQSPVLAQQAPAIEASCAAEPIDAVLSPMVGTAYLRPEPSAQEFIKIGGSVSKGDTLVIIEAMKVMNPIRAKKSGTIEKILVSDGQPVEFGDALVVIR